MNSVSSSVSSWAESSFLPPWRAIYTENVSPFLLKTLSMIAAATSLW
jgi:hypothetical protein